jgi:peptidoglycan hydrolase-like protein with peptidoglycan-binding domain
MLKHALICSAPQWKTLSQINDLKNIDWATLIAPSLMVKKRVVEKDPFEMNVRKSLNFGHTIGHAVESFFLEKENALLHGEAIAIGMVCEAYLSHKKVGLSKIELAKIAKFILKTYGKQQLPPEHFGSMIAVMAKDKKNEGATINCTFLKKIGNFVINCTVTQEEVVESLYFYNEYVNSYEESLQKAVKAFEQKLNIELEENKKKLKTAAEEHEKKLKAIVAKNEKQLKAAVEENEKQLKAAAEEKEQQLKAAAEAEKKAKDTTMLNALQSGALTRQQIAAIFNVSIEYIQQIDNA